jgi:hypothetical protein
MFDCIKHRFGMLAAAVMLANPAGAQTSDAHVVLTPEYACLVTPPLRIADNAQAISWAPDSRRILALSCSTPIITPDKLKNLTSAPEVDLFVNRYNTDSHISTMIYRRHFETNPMLGGNPVWLGGTNTALQTIVWYEIKTQTGPDGKEVRSTLSKQMLLCIDAYRGTVKEIDVEPGDLVVESPVSPAALLIHSTYGSDGACTVTAIDVDGNLGRSTTLPLHAMVAQTDWLEDGKSVGLTLFPAPTAAAPGKPATAAESIPKYVVYSISSGTFQAADKSKVKIANKKPSPPMLGLFLKTTTQHVTDGGVDDIIHPLWITSTLAVDKKQSLVTPDADMSQLSPNGSVIAFRSAGNAFVSDVIRLPAAEYKAARAAALRSTLLSNGKQVALAALMWSADHDDTLPSSANINDELMPYLKNSQLFDGLNWTYPGGPISSIESPAETIIGTIDGADGSAVMYADGHVKWRNR